MSLWNYGPIHTWFAWFPVLTSTGWKWLCKVRRQRVYLSEAMPGAAEWWDYDDIDKKERP